MQRGGMSYQQHPTAGVGGGLNPLFTASSDIGAVAGRYSVACLFLLNKYLCIGVCMYVAQSPCLSLVILEYRQIFIFPERHKARNISRDVRKAQSTLKT